MLLNYDQFTDLVKGWYGKKDKTQRLGQFLLNITPYPIQDSEIFYNENHEAAAALYHDRYVVASMDFVKEWDEVKTAEGIPKIDIDEIKKMISGVEFNLSGQDGTGYQTTCTLTTYFGYKASGKSDTIHPQRFSEAVGRRFAFERALSTLIESHAYLERFLVFNNMSFEELKGAIHKFQKAR